MFFNELLQTTMAAFHNPSLVRNYQTLYSNVFTLSILCSVWAMDIVAVILVFFLG